MSDRASSAHDTRRRKMAGSKMAVKKLMSAMHTTPMDMLLAFIEP